MKALAPLIVLVVAATSFNALAASSIAGEIVCKKNDRKLSSKDPASGETVEIVKGYDCGQLRVEFVRLNELAFALLENKDSKRITAALAMPTLVNTNVVENYRKFRSRHGTSHTTRLVSDEMGTSSEEHHKDFATIFRPDGSGWGSNYYPGIDEMQKLSRDQWPEGFKIFVSEQADPQKAVRIPTPTLWRSLGSQDISNLAENAERYKSTFPQSESFPTMVSNGALDFLLAVSGGILPEELIRLQGWHSEFTEGCALTLTPTPLSAKRPRLFIFETQLPELYFDTILLRNRSKKAIDVSQFVGQTQPGTGLRRLDHPGRPVSAISDLSEKISIAPGQSAILPTAMLLRPRELAPCCDYVARDQTKAVDAINEYKSAGYAVSIENYQTPTFPIYFEVLPAYSVSGLKTSLGEVSFERTRPLRLSFNVLLEEGSCPYLMSKPGLSDEELWSDYGKILHPAQTRARKGRHVEQMQGAPSVFRIEEREPEIAFIDMVRLTVTYVDGTKETFLPSLDALKSNDGNEARLGWGQAMEFSFPVRDSQDRRAPLTSELEVIGYYERIDLNRLVDMNWSPAPAPGQARDKPGAAEGLFCPGPGKSTAVTKIMGVDTVPKVESQPLLEAAATIVNGR